MGPDTQPDALLRSALTHGDARLAIDPISGTNRYFCPPIPALQMACFASCTASPISAEAYEAAAACLRRITAPGSARTKTDRAVAEAAALPERVANAFGVADLAEAILSPSGTDATLLLVGLLAAERPGEPIVSILAEASETGSGVPLAAAGRCFWGGPGSIGHNRTGAALSGFPDGTKAVCIPLRGASGEIRDPRAIDTNYAHAVATAAGRAVVHLIDGSKTGLVAPSAIPDGAEAVVDACQARLPRERVRAYLSSGWPVIVTGSKFYGGRAFSGAILFPRGRLAAIDRRRLPAELACGRTAAANLLPMGALLGTTVRWTAALVEIEAFARLSPEGTSERAAAAAQAISDWMRSAATVCPIDTPAVAQGPAEIRSVFGFAVRCPARHGRLLSSAELRPIYQRLGGRGVLVGQPVAVGDSAGALRIAIGARNLRDPNLMSELDRVFLELDRAIGEVSMLAAE